MNPAGEAFEISRTGEMTPLILPDGGLLDGGFADGGLPDGGLPPPTLINPFE